jgi:rhamnogalacturonan endolyase
MKAEAWQLTANGLESLWRYHSDEGGRRLRGQGAHFTQSVDLDGDGRDEVVLGSVVLDDNGVPLWSTGLGHPDHAYIGDHDPQRPGLEIYYGIESRRQQNGMCQVDAKSGKILWGWDQATQHIHSTGLCSDIDPLWPGAESYSADSADHKRSGDPWLWSAKGRILDRTLDWDFGRNCVWWDADLQREVLLGHELVKFGGKAVAGRIAGSVILVADVLGDWREEVICSLPGELRIHTTTIPAMDRRTTLLADPLYRLDVAMCAMGYTQVPNLTTSLEATAPNLNLTLLDAATGPNLRVVASAPMDRGIKGQLRLTATGASVRPAGHAIDLAPGERVVVTATAVVDPANEGQASLTAEWQGEGVDLRNSARLPPRAQGR